jgi:hypothetical protein
VFVASQTRARLVYEAVVLGECDDWILKVPVFSGLLRQNVQNLILVRPVIGLAQGLLIYGNARRH